MVFVWDFMYSKFKNPIATPPVYIFMSQKRTYLLFLATSEQQTTKTEEESWSSCFIYDHIDNYFFYGNSNY